MERTFSQDERIRRAQEIYARRQNLRERTKRATVNLSEPKNFKLFKKLALQIVICILIYFIFYLLTTTNYSFSEETLSKAKEWISYDYDFYSIYTMVVENVNNYLYSEQNPDENQGEEKQENEGDIEESEQKDKEEQNADEMAQTDEEGVNQLEVSYTEESETDRIKSNYSFALPVTGYRISSEFGEREVTASVVTAYHKGIDIAAYTGTPILASTDGEVIISKYSASYGNYVMIQNNEVKTVYAHCQDLLVSERRQSFTRTRNSKSTERLGDVTGAHLHFEIRINDVCVDPRTILKFEEPDNAD